MVACPSQAVLVDFVEGRLPPGGAAEVQVHLSRCLRCRAGVAARATADPDPPPTPDADAPGLPPAGPPAGPEGMPGLVRIGSVIGPYRVTQKIGEGGMGAVYAAVHQQIQRVVAIKVLYLEHSSNPKTLSRFLNEARAVNIVGHPGLVSIFEVGCLDSGAAYLVMEHLEGELLSARLRKGPLGPGCVRLFRQMAAALMAAHEKGIIHRDLKPGNVMIVADPEAAGGERTKILDFGIAKLAQQHLSGRDAGLATRTGMTMGTPVYMSPEQVRAQEVDDRADVYSLGIMLHECLSGTPPFRGGSVMEIMSRHVYEAPPSLRQAGPGTPDALSALVDAMLAKSPADRPAMSEVAAVLVQLERAGADVPGANEPFAPVPSQRRFPSGPRPVLALAGIIVIALFGLVLVGIPRRHPARVAAPVQQQAAGVLSAPAAPVAPQEPPRQAVAETPQMSIPVRQKTARKTVRSVPPPPQPVVPLAPQPAQKEDWTDGKIKIFK